MNAATILLCSADPKLADAVGQAAGSVAGLALDTCDAPADAWTRVRHRPPALVLLHLDGTDTAPADGFLRRTRLLPSAPPVLIVSDANDPNRELKYLRQSVADYLTRPLDLSRLRYLLDSHTVEARLLPRLKPSEPAIDILGDDDPFLFAPDGGMGRLMEQVQRVAPQTTTLLLGGETGTGKTRLARLVHELSGRRDEPFLTVHCAALSASLIESEMFGHVRGAFTGADRDRAGKFAEAGHGTLLLDDIDALPAGLQAKLLRTVDERVFEPVGSDEPRPLRARIIAASNRPLADEVAAGRFRADLFYRLNVVAFELPPLRERREVVPAVARKFVADLALSSGRAVGGLSAEALAILQAHDWPGNIRELRNVVERAVALCDGSVIEPDDLPDALRCLVPTPSRPILSSPASLERSKEEAEVQCITEALSRHNNNRLRAAAALGISRMTLYKKLHKYGLIGT